MISKFLFLAFICLAGQVIAQSDEECFIPGECVSSIHIDGEVVSDRDDCRALCKTTPECAWFTFYPNGKFCQLFKNCDTLNVESCDDCLSGQPECETTKPICFVSGECDGEVLQTSQAVASRSDCLRACQQTKNCTWFTYLPSAFVCIMYESCPVFDETCGDKNGCVSGESRCEVEYTPESPWHLLIGGKTGAVYTNTAELYNWQTGKQCFIEPLPEGFGLHSGVLMDGDPFVCGGANPTGRVQCYQYQRDKKHWIKRVDLLVATSQAAGVYRPDLGWMLFGGNDIGTTQKLASVDSKWEKGPAVQALSIKGQCAVQISENVTAFIGGSVNPTSIFTYDWSSPTPTFVIQGQSLLKKRVGSTCGLMLGTDGLPVVVIIGGQEKGMEVWNPRSLTIENLWDEIPAEEGAATGLSYGGMIPIKDGSEFMYYGGYKGSHHKGLWKYVVAENSWTRIGSTLVARGEHVTLPVSGIECPP